MKGGYQIIDIRKLNLTLSNSTQSITDAEILEQLRNLRAYIQKGHDFTKPLDNALKCIQIRYRDQKNGEKLEACQWANIETSNNSLTYEIKTKYLMIEIVFEEKTDEYSNKYYDIKTAKYLYNHNEIVEGNLTVGGNLVADEINGETNPSVKPIYWHGLDIYKSGENSVQAHVLKNDNTPINSIDLLIAWVKSLGVSVVNLSVNGAFVYNATTYSCYLLRFRISEGEITTVGIYYVGTSGYNSIDVDEADFRTYFTNVEDAINKIN